MHDHDPPTTARSRSLPRADRLLSTILLVLLAAVVIPSGPLARTATDASLAAQLPPVLPLVVLLVAQPVAVWLMLARRRALPVAVAAVLVVVGLVLAGVVDWVWLPGEEG